mmetsp:Transcript_127700/g.367542  ORF Transcript_127700/g.367542 Transcript_127700/m.367542 type:complete len:130 (-) Transcript_127700:817-1206(-)
MRGDKPNFMPAPKTPLLTTIFLRFGGGSGLRSPSTGGGTAVSQVPTDGFIFHGLLLEGVEDACSEVTNAVGGVHSHEPTEGLNANAGVAFASFADAAGAAAADGAAVDDRPGKRPQKPAGTGTVVKFAV